ncbi:hypothetical protein BP6252_00520 [Coleophoma cylindrospora]|uniref:Uncharacterized protein n=1 Tax=Coleophoma cylindrospora TaxID=1849047 RepID=A0A3D8SRV5_9HELO|nr:hypothetical protein BP6252_00520 [Coleophoma cylindrospora]
MSLSLHSEPSLPPKKHPGERLAEYFNNFFATVTAISTLGASITFSKILQTPVAPWIDYGFSDITIQNYIAISWLCFVLDLAITSFAASALSLWRPQAIRYFGTSDSDDRRIVMWYATVVSIALYGLLVTAFVFLSLVVTAYAGPLGWVAVAFSAFFGACGIGAIVWQSPIGSKRFGIESRILASPPRPGPIRRPSFVEEDYYYKEGLIVHGHYVDDGTRRTSMAPRPISTTVPDYTMDMRRMRAIRTSGDYQYENQV